MNFEEALELATECHKGQKRWNGSDYITHPIAVASKFKDEHLKIVAILHDVIEDSDMTGFDLGNRHDLDTKLVRSIQILTRADGQTYLDYIRRVKRDEIATLVKIQDLLHNLSDSKPGSMQDKYIMALYMLSGRED